MYFVTCSTLILHSDYFGATDLHPNDQVIPPKTVWSKAKFLFLLLEPLETNLTVEYLFCHGSQFNQEWFKIWMDILFYQTEISNYQSPGNFIYIVFPLKYLLATPVEFGKHGRNANNPKIWWSKTFLFVDLQFGQGLTETKIIWRLLHSHAWWLTWLLNEISAEAMAVICLHVVSPCSQGFLKNMAEFQQ